MVKFWAALGLVIFAGLGLYYFLRNEDAGTEVVAVLSGELVQEVNVTGKVKPAQSVQLGFDRSGRISGVFTRVGERVFPGQTLVSLYNADLFSQLREAEANLKAEEAKLEELKRGTRPEDLRVAEAKLAEAEEALADKIASGYTAADDAIRNKTDKFFSNPRSANPQLSFSSPQYEIELESERARMEKILLSWADDVFQAEKNLKEVRDFLGTAALAVNDLTGTNLSQSTIDTYQSDVSAARTSVNTAINNLSGAKADWLIAESELAVKKAGSSAEEILGQEAKAEKAQASVDNIKAQISKTIITSPLSGVVSRMEAKVGEIAAASAEIQSGPATAAANIFNMVNTNVIGHNWLLALINIAGDWLGDIAFGRPDLWVGETITSLSREVKPDDSFTVNLVVANNGDTDATDVRLYDDFNGRYLEIDSLGGGEPDSLSSGVLWRLGTIPPGGTRTVFYTLKIKSNLPFGASTFRNIAKVWSYEDDGNPDDNKELTTFTLRRARPYIPNALHIPGPNLSLKKKIATSTVETGQKVDWQIQLLNQDLGEAYDVVVEDILLQASSSEPTFRHSWDLKNVPGLKKALIDYTVEFSEKTPPGLYRNLVRARGKDRFGAEVFAYPLESEFIVLGSAVIPVASATSQTLTLAETPVPPEEETGDNLIPEVKAKEESAGPIRVVSETISPPDSTFSNYLALVFSSIKFTWPWLFVALLALILALLVRRHED